MAIICPEGLEATPWSTRRLRFRHEPSAGGVEGTVVFVTLASRKDDVNCHAKSVDRSRMSVSPMWSRSGRVVEPVHPINLTVGSPTPQHSAMFGAHILFLNNVLRVCHSLALTILI